MTTQEQIAALEDARARIADPARWTQGAYARDAAGKPTDAAGDAAVCWCALGSAARTLWVHTARNEVKYHSITPLFQRVTERLQWATPDINVQTINDWDDADTAHAAVLAAYDRAIATLRGQEVA